MYCSIIFRECIFKHFVMGQTEQEYKCSWYWNNLAGILSPCHWFPNLLVGRNVETIHINLEELWKLRDLRFPWWWQWWCWGFRICGLLYWVAGLLLSDVLKAVCSVRASLINNPATQYKTQKIEPTTSEVIESVIALQIVALLTVHNKVRGAQISPKI
jgi:hypothetical protein